ncbi:glycosyltransferase family 4 protein [Cytobacillus sp. IB215665]|uniref:glycosyltransferase family 4 protein n=1 Tax=Cytobacillus sp. IB215665 TaxID=3097357 RepID=UPI002A14B7BE|nr:glycosyltransferase family 4 protein [Cytobacillus sp. IB215665]MDX8363739.1 glycosyltransferase family 4 protein [Cytobacillus sp. IB215665]
MNHKNVKVLHMSTIDLTIKDMLLDKMDELRELNYTIEFLSDDTGLVTDIESRGYRHITVSMSRKIKPLKDLASIMKIVKILKNEKYDIVHTHAAKAGVIGRIAARIAGVKIIIHTSHGLPFYQGQSNIKNFVYKGLERVASFFSHAYFSQNKEDLNVIRKIVPKRIITAYEGNGIPLTKIDNYEKLTVSRKTELQQSIGINNNEFVFLMGARFEGVKNYQMLLRSIANLKADRPCKFLLAGTGEELESMKLLAENLRIKDKVLFLGYRKDIYDLIQLCDAVILTSEKEGIPRILMEAMAFNKPVLATNVLGTKELVVHNQTGELVELNDIEGLTETMSKWISENYRLELEQYAKNSRERIMSEFTEAKVAVRLDSLYKDLISKVYDINSMNERLRSY